MSESKVSAAELHPHRRWIAVIPVVVAIIVWVIDQLTKSWVIEHLTEHDPVLVIGETLQWMFVRNPGAAFSFGVNATWVFTILSSGVALFVIFQLRKIASLAWGIFLGLLLGGTVGNLTDRLFREPGFPNGHVIDFIYTPWMMPAIYNVADIAICVGMGLFILITILGIRLDGIPKKLIAQQHEREQQELEESERDARQKGEDSPVHESSESEQDSSPEDVPDSEKGA